MINRRFTLIALIFALFIGMARPMGAAHAAPILHPNFWITDGTVNETIREGNTLYLGGSFKYVGPTTGPSIMVDQSIGLRNADFPTTNGIINTIISDGAGGWYIGGSFSQVGGLSRTYLARILANNTVDPTFAPVLNNEVYALLLNGTTLYVGGAFTQAEGQSRWALAAYTTTTGQLSNWLNFIEKANGLARVYTFAIDGTTLYIGGDFDKVNIISSAKNLVAVHTTTTTQALSWKMDTNGVVRSLAIHKPSNVIYIGGDFSSVTAAAGMQTANRLAQGSLYPFSVAAAWNPQVVGFNVRSLLVSGDTLFVGGLFSAILGQSRANFAALNASTEALLAMNPAFGGEVNNLALDGGKLYAVGNFYAVAAQDRWSTVALNPTTGAVDSWTAHINGNGNAVAASGGKVVIGGAFRSGGGVLRNNAAALSTLTGAALSWNPNVTGSGVNTLLYHNGTIYIGGTFSKVSGQNRANIAAVDATTGVVSAWNPTANNSVNALVKDATKLYVGGAFNNISATSRFGLAAYTLSNGTLDSLNIALSGGAINVLLLNGATLYLGGTFTSISATPRNGAAAISLAGVLQAWNPNVTGTVYALALSGSRVFLGGAISKVGNITRDNIASVDATTGALDLWNPGANNAVHALVFTAAGLYVGGQFTIIGLATRNFIALINITSGAVSSLNFNFVGLGSIVTDIDPNGGWVYLSGNFTLGNYSGYGILAFSDDGATRETIGLFRPSNQLFFLRNANSTGAPTLQIKLGLSTDIPLTGDWNGDGLDTPGLWRPSNATFYLSNQTTSSPVPAAVHHTFAFGLAGDIPIVGDWNGDGKDSIGVFRPSQKKFYLRNTLNGGVAESTITFGLSGDIPLAGDWNGDGNDTPGVWRPSSKTFLVSNTACAACTAPISASAVFGTTNDLPFVGDWDGDGTTGIGLFRPSNATMYLRNTVTAGAPNFSFAFGLNGDKPVAGRWVSGPVFDPAPEAAPSFVPKG